MSPRAPGIPDLSSGVIVNGGSLNARDRELVRLPNSLRDVGELLALYATWSGASASEIARTLSKTLCSMLQLDVAFVGLGDELDDLVVHVGNGVAARKPPAVYQEIQGVLGSDTLTWPPLFRGNILGDVRSIATFRLGSIHGFGFIVAASARDDFPTEAERLVLEVARNHALLALQEAILQGEDRRRASDAGAAALVEGLPGLVAVLAPDGSLERVNRQIVEYCGQSREELRDWGSNGTVHPDDMPVVAAIFGASIASGVPYKIEQRLRRFDGAYRWFDNSGNPLRDESGAIVEWHVLLSDIDDLKNAQEAVGRRERELREQLESFPQMLWSATAEGDIDHCNERLLAFSGLTADEVMNGGWVNLIHPEDREPTAQIWMHSVSTGDPYSVEVRQFHIADNTYRWVLTLALPFRDDSGRIIKWYGSCVDIHDRKEAEEAVRSSERHLTQLIATIPQNMFSATAEGLVDYLNPQMRDWFGRADEKIMADEWVNLVHPDDREATVEAWTSAVAAGIPYRHQVRFLFRDGDYHWCIGEARPLRDESGSIVAWHGVVNDIHDLKLAEEALKASEQRLRLTIDTIPVLAWSARPDGTADFYNRHYLDYVGRNVDKLKDWEWLELVHPEDLTAITSAWDVAQNRGASAEVEARLRRHDGVYRWFLFQTSPLRDEGGNVLKWYGVNTDIEDFKRAQQDLAAREGNLREAHDHLSQAQRLSQTGSFTTDVIADTHIWSDELYRILEHDREERPTFGAFRARIHAEDLATFDAGFKRAITEHAEFDEIFRIVTSAGAIKYLHAIAHFSSGDLGRPIVMGSIQDISDSKHAEHELRRSAYLLESAEQISQTGSFRWDMTSGKLVWSAQMYRIHEIDEGEEIDHQKIVAMTHPDDVEMIQNKVQLSFQGIDSPDSPYRLVMPDGRIKYLDMAYRVITHGDGEVESVGVARDVTQRRQFQDALDKLRSDLTHITRVSTLGELAASITHEVNQPLSGIITNASACLRLLSNDPPDIAGAIKTAQRSIRDGNRAAEVIKRLHPFYRNNGTTLEPLDLNDAAREVIAICSHDLQRRRIVLTADFHSALQPVLGDRIQLQQVILNLVLNAADAVEEGERKSRRIFVETSEAEPGRAQLMVRDTGRGLSSDDAGRLFEAFFTTKAKGMGIGLSVSKSIIEHHEGSLWARAADDGGAIFAFSIPLAPAAPKRGAEAR